MKGSKPYCDAAVPTSPNVSAKWIVAMLAVAAAVPTLLIWKKASYVTGDSYMFMRAGMNFVRSLGYVGMDGAFMYVQDRPLYPIAVGVASLFTVHVETAARLISLAGATLAVVAFYWLVKQRHSPKIAGASALVFALLPLRVWSGQWILTDGLALGLMLAGVAIVFAKTNSTRKAYLAAGVIIGLAYLTRFEAIVIGVGALSYILFFTSEKTFSQRMVDAGILAVGLLLMAVPHHAWLYQQTGTLSPHRLVDNLYAAEALYRGWTMPFDVRFNDATGQFAKAAPNLTFAAIAERYVFFAKEEFLRLLYLSGTRLLVAPLLMVGAVKFIRDLCRRQTDALWQALLLLPLLIFPLFRIEDRYLLPALSVLCLWMVRVAFDVPRWLQQQLTQQRFTIVSVAPVVVIALLIGSYGYRLATQLPKTQATDLPREVAAWMKSNRLPKGSVIAQEPALAFYDDATHVWLPFGPPERVLDYARQRNARYVFVSSTDAANPLRDALLSQRDVRSDLSLLQTFHSPAGEAKLFELAANSGDRAVAQR